MKFQKLIPIGILLLLSVATVSAQSALPNPHDDACWSSLSALRACDLQAYDKVMEQAERCTSYPEYQCLPPEVSLYKTSATNSAKAVSKAANSADNAVAVSAPVTDTNPQASNSK